MLSVIEIPCNGMKGLGTSGQLLLLADFTLSPAPGGAERNSRLTFLLDHARLPSTSYDNSPSIMTTKAAQILKPPISHYHFVPVASRTALPIPVIPLHNGNIQEFREQAFNPQVPVHLKNSNTPEQDLQLEHDIHHNLRKHDASIMQYEYRSSNRPPDQRAKEISFLTSQSRKRGFQLPHDIEDPRKEFHRFNAPLRLMYGSLERQSKSRIRSLYIAQMPIEELPLGMKELFPAPMDIISCGKGDIYGSSIWIG